MGIMMLTCRAAHSETVDQMIERGLDMARRQSLLMAKDLEQKEGRLPKSIANGALETSDCYWWCSGFFPGVLWYAYESAPSEELKNYAQLYTKRVEKVKYVTDNHDVGFMLYCSYGNGYRLTRSDEYKQVLVQGAKSLATRYNPAVKAIRSWEFNKHIWQYPVIIDNMMNLELLTWASGATGDERFREIAVNHANTTMKNHFRDDYSSYHVVSYDTITGKPHVKMTHQGYADESAWARGQAWALYGYTMMARETGKPEYLQHAKHVADFLMSHPNMPADKVPYWDYNAPDIPKAPRDASAAAVMASALIELSRIDSSQASAGYLAFAEDQLRSLSSSEYLAEPGTNCNFILKHSTGHLPGNSEVDVPLTYADYYYVEALLRLKKLRGEAGMACSGPSDRQAWVETLCRIADPVLTNLSSNTLREKMPYQSLASDRKKYSYLEAVGRTLCGIAPWLELGPDNTPEGQLRVKYGDLAVKGLANLVDPQSPDYYFFGDPSQSLVDAAFLAQGLLRAPTQLWARLDEATQQRMVTEWKNSRAIRPNENNWLLFTSIIEAALLKFTGECDTDKLLYGVRRFRDDWYKGDAMYGDGEKFRMDYYNSYVIHPMLTDVLRVMAEKGMAEADFLPVQEQRHARYAEILERFISPEGTFPVVGRSIPYRFGAFHALSQAALLRILPKSVSPAQVRGALTAVIRNQMKSPDNFDADGWLRVGFAGDQINISEYYINTGSSYLCAAGLVALGLPATDEFWAAPDAEWTGLKAWSGKDVRADAAVK